jgi:hypothetical protein
VAYTNPRGQHVSDQGDLLVTLMACTLTDYTAAGTTTPVVGDAVTVSSTGNWYCKRAADNASSKMGRVTKIELAPVGSAVGYVVVEWFDAIRVVELNTDDLSTVTLLNSAIKDGDTATADNFDAGATTGNLIVVSKSGTSGAGTIAAMLFAA